MVYNLLTARISKTSFDAEVFSLKIQSFKSFKKIKIERFFKDLFERFFGDAIVEQDNRSGFLTKGLDLRIAASEAEFV